METQETYYRPGLIFLSEIAGYTYHIRDQTFHPPLPDGTREPDRPALVADFGRGLFGSFQTLTADDGSPVTLEVLGVEGYSGSNFRADMRGGAFDLDANAKADEWTDEEREFVARRMLRLNASLSFNDFRLYEPAVPEAPWPTYDETHHFGIAKLAAEAGLVPQALAYERFTKNRQGVIDALQAKLDEQAVDEEAVAV